MKNISDYVCFCLDIAGVLPVVSLTRVTRLILLPHPPFASLSTPTLRMQYTGLLNICSINLYIYIYIYIYINIYIIIVRLDHIFHLVSPVGDPLQWVFEDQAVHDGDGAIWGLLSERGDGCRGTLPTPISSHRNQNALQYVYVPGESGPETDLLGCQVRPSNFLLYVSALPQCRP